MIKIAIVTLAITSAVLFLFLLAVIAHILKIQKELKEIANEQSDQNQDIRRLIIRLNETNLTVNNITEYLSGNTIAKQLAAYSGPIGEA